MKPHPFGLSLVPTSAHPSRKIWFFDAKRILIAFLFVSTFSASAEQTQFSPEVANQVRDRMKQMESVKLDLRGVRAREGDRQIVDARQVIKQILLTGDIVLATHALTFLGYYPDPSLKDVLILRRQTLGNSWAENQLKISIDSYLVKVGDAKTQRQFIELLTSQQSTDRARAYRVLRDTEPSVFPANLRDHIESRLKSAAEAESDPAAQAVAYSALVFWHRQDGKKYAAKLVEAARSPVDRKRFRASVELSQLRLWEDELPPESSVELSKTVKIENPENPFKKELIAKAVGGSHGEKMFAVEMLAQMRDEEIDKMFKGYGKSQLWQERLQSAFYLLMIDDKKEAKLRLKKEEQPFVQLALLCTIISANH